MFEPLSLDDRYFSSPTPTLDEIRTRITDEFGGRTQEVTIATDGNIYLAAECEPVAYYAQPFSSVLVKELSLQEYERELGRS